MTHEVLHPRDGKMELGMQTVLPFVLYLFVSHCWAAAMGYDQEGTHLSLHPYGCLANLDLGQISTSNTMRMCTHHMRCLQADFHGHQNVGQCIQYPSDVGGQDTWE